MSKVGAGLVVRSHSPSPVPRPSSPNFWEDGKAGKVLDVHEILKMQALADSAGLAAAAEPASKLEQRRVLLQEAIELLQGGHTGRAADVISRVVQGVYESAAQLSVMIALGAFEHRPRALWMWQAHLLLLFDSSLNDSTMWLLRGYYVVTMWLLCGQYLITMSFIFDDYMAGSPSATRCGAAAPQSSRGILCDI